jgi:hypothetical protein
MQQQQQEARQVEKRPEDQLVDVVVADSVGPLLAQHLDETGRGHEDPLKLQHKVQMSVWKQWGTATMKSFQDADGLGWYASVSNVMGGEDLVAVIRTIHGTRMVCAVVESDEVEDFIKTGQWRTEAARGMSPELLAEIEALEHNPPAAPGRPGRATGWAPPGSNGAGAAQPYVEPEPQPDDPRLIVWWPEQDDGKVDMTTDPKVEKTTYGEAQQRVLKLLMKGAHVEVWESPKTPEIKVSL